MPFTSGYGLNIYGDTRTNQAAPLFSQAKEDANDAVDESLCISRHRSLQGIACESTFLYDGTGNHFWADSDKPAIINWWNGKSAVFDFTNPDAVQGFHNFSSTLARVKRNQSGGC